MGYARLMVGFLLKNSRAAPILHAHIRIVAAHLEHFIDPQERRRQARVTHPLTQADIRRMGGARQALGKNPGGKRA